MGAADVITSVRSATNKTKYPHVLSQSSTGSSWTIDLPTRDAQITLASGLSSRYLVAHDFDFNIPNNANITGIAFVITRSGEADIYDNVVSAVISGIVQSEDKSKIAQWLDVGSGATYGANGDLWSVNGNLTPDVINRDDFGIAISVSNVNASGSIAYIKEVGVTAYYTFSEFNEGNACVYANKFGAVKLLKPTIKKPAGWVALSGWLHDRLDDVTYY